MTTLIALVSLTLAAADAPAAAAPAADAPAAAPTAAPAPAPAPTASPEVEALKNASTPDLIARGKAAVAELGSYKIRSSVEERIKGKMQEPRTLQMWVREQPFAVRVEYVAGPAKGRRILYDSTTRPDDVRAKESGFLGIAGALWIGVHSSLAFGDTNHPITDVGLGAVLRIQSDDNAKAKPFGGYARTDQGLNERGRYCIQYDAPAGATLYAARSLICYDPATALPLEVTDWDKKGLLERFIFQKPEPHAAEGQDVFTQKAAGL